MAAQVEIKRPCPGVNCSNDASTMQCPKCLSMGIDTFFCGQDCFKRSWTEHKQAHKTAPGGPFNPFTSYAFTGPLRPAYPLSTRRQVPEKLAKPDYAVSGIPHSEQNYFKRSKIEILDEKAQKAMRKVCRLAREVLDLAAAELKPGATTDHIDKVVHEACIARDSYPSPLNYMHFPKSVCTSINEVICHGIPDQRPLEEGDIVNIDVTLFHKGYHGDLNETYYVTDPTNPKPPSHESWKVVETSRQCLEDAIKLVKPGMPFREPGNAIQRHADSTGCSVVKTYVGHGVNTLFHCAPNIPHYGKNKAVGTAKEGMCFTIEPMINLGIHKDKTWPDNWTSTTTDGKRSAQFEHTLLVTKDGVEVLTARLPSSPGGPIPEPMQDSASSK